MKVYFVRHGKTEWNLEGRFQGYSGDSKLLEESFLDLESLGEYLATVPFDKIYSSDLQRAHITAERIADLNRGTVSLFGGFNIGSPHLCGSISIKKNGPIAFVETSGPTPSGHFRTAKRQPPPNLTPTISKVFGLSMNVSGHGGGAWNDCAAK